MNAPSDLFRPVDAELAKHVLSSWGWLLDKNYTVIGMSLFGDTFLKDEKGCIFMLDVLNGKLKQIAYCIEEFEFDLNGETSRRDWLMEPLARQLIVAGVRVDVGQCYAFKTPPALGGKLWPENVVLWNLFKYHEGLSSLFRQISDLPPGTQIVPK